MKTLSVLFLALCAGVLSASLVFGVSPSEMMQDILGMHPMTANWLINTSAICLPLTGLLLFSIRTPTKKNSRS